MNVVVNGEQRQLPDGLAPFYVGERRVIQLHAQQAREQDVDAQIRLTPPEQVLARFQLQQPGAGDERVEDLVACSLERLELAQHGDAHPWRPVAGRLLARDRRPGLRRFAWFACEAHVNARLTSPQNIRGHRGRQEKREEKPPKEPGLQTGLHHTPSL